MNIFVLNSHPHLAAAGHCDVHVISQIKESAQIMSTALHLHGVTSDKLYKPTHLDHPCVLWAAKSYGNFEWLYYLAFFLNSRFELYGKKQEEHKSFGVCWDAFEMKRKIPRGALTTWVQVVGAHQIPVTDADPLVEGHPTIQAYRNYYSAEKRMLADSTGKLKPATWTGVPVPEWMKQTVAPTPGVANIFEEVEFTF